MHNDSGVTGFCFPLSCQEDIDRLERSIRANPAIRAQYIRYLASKKTPKEAVSKCLEKFFSHWSLYNFCLQKTEKSHQKKYPIKQYKIFTECMLEAWKSHALSRDNLLQELQIALAAAHESSNQSHYKRRKRSEFIQMMLRQKQIKSTK